MLSRRPRPLAALALACAALAMPHTVRAQEPWRALVGCYREKEGLFALDSVPFVGVFADEEGARLVRSGHRWADDLEKMWRMPAPDSVRIRFEGGMYGWTYHLAVRDSMLIGVVTTKTDVVLRGRYPQPERVQAVRVPCPPDSEMSNPRPDSAELADLYGYTAARPAEAALEADPWHAVQPLRAWLLAHPQATARWNLRHNARGLFRRAADYDVRANRHELLGTYRLEVERTGGPTRVFYGRTTDRPFHALLYADTVPPYPEAPRGYYLPLTLSLDSSSLPTPGPGRRHRDAYGSNGPDNGRFEVRLPGDQPTAGAQRFRGTLRLVTFAHAFEDPELARWDYEWFHAHARNGSLPPVGELVVWPDGRVTFTQREELGPGQVITVRGERISPDTWVCENRAIC